MREKRILFFRSLLAWLLGVAITSNIIAQESCPLPDKLTFSSFKHPKVQQSIQPLLVQAYKGLGIEVEFIVTSSYRDLLLVSDYVISGSSIFAEDIIDTLPDVIKVQPSLIKVAYILLCNQGVRCENDILIERSDQHWVAVSTAMSKGLKRHYPHLPLENLFITTEVKNIISALKKKRVDYGLYPISAIELGGLKEIPEGLNYSVLYEINSYHVINKELMCLQPQISASITAELAKFK